MVSSHCPSGHPNGEKLKRGVGSKTEGPQTELLENRKVSLSAPQPNFLYFLTSFSLKLRASFHPGKYGGGRGVCSSGILAFPVSIPDETAPSLPARFTPRPKAQSPWFLTPQPNPNSRITHCLPGIAILLRSPLNVAGADVTLTQTLT